MDKDAQIMKMGLIIKACINATCLFTRKVFDGTEVPGKKKNNQKIFKTLKSSNFVFVRYTTIDSCFGIKVMII